MNEKHECSGLNDMSYLDIEVTTDISDDVIEWWLSLDGNHCTINYCPMGGEKLSSIHIIQGNQGD
ncbi:hypothetical protein D1872_38030 [compost metagenome]